MPVPSSVSRTSQWVILNGIRLIVQDLREASRAAEAEFGVSAAQLFVLQTLATAPGLSVNELAERTYTHQSSVSVVLKKLISRGYVAAKPSKADARRLELTLKAKGVRLAKRAPDAVQARLIEGINELTARERSALANGIRRVLVGMGSEDRLPPMFLEDLT